jgi:hypothetical protein
MESRIAVSSSAWTAVRVWCVLDGIVFAASALLNFGVRIPAGFTGLAFPAHVWQAGVGEAVIACPLIGSAVSGSRRLSWVAFWMSVVGIAFGLISRQVQGPARQIHVVLVPMAIVLGIGLLWARRGDRGEPARLDPAA